MGFKLIYLGEGYRMLRRSIRVKKQGFKQYKGSAKQICKQIIEDCWNKEEQFFKTSNGNFCQFWSRDFGMCAEHLVNLGHRGRVVKTLRYALERFRKSNKITTTITPGGKPFNFPTYAPDSLAYLLWSIKVSKSRALLNDYRIFLNKQINIFFETVIDKQTRLVRKDREFSSMKDLAKRTSSCYDNCMAAMVKQLAKELKLDNRFGNCCTKKLIKDNFWTGSYFIDSLSDKRLASGDANTYPYWTGLFTEKSMIQKSINKIKKLGLDKPFPLRYTTKPEQKMYWTSGFIGGYEDHTAWIHLGGSYLGVVS